jgi:hypothetical protein
VRVARCSCLTDRHPRSRHRPALSAPGAAVHVRDGAPAPRSAPRNALDKNTSAVEHARRMWGDDGGRGAMAILKSASSPALTSTPSWAGLYAHVVPMFLASLVPQSAGADLLARGLQLSFDGAGAIQLPLIGRVPAGFVGESKPIPVVQYNISAGVKLEPHKLALITALSREIVDGSNAEAICRASLTDSASAGLDAALYSANAGTADAPPGILNGIAATAASTATLKQEALAEDLAAININAACCACGRRIQSEDFRAYGRDLRATCRCGVRTVEVLAPEVPVPS